jgi:branched-subunit amino acid aminotransferase/4-amino-4-deoxychorismate lyase
MIWVGGRIVEDDALSVSVLDRTFEHGLGLFETLRTWSGRAPLLERHLARMKKSAKELGLSMAHVMPPDEGAVAALIRQEDVGGDRLVRITLSGGIGESGRATLWMRTGQLPVPTRHEGAVVDLGTWNVPRDDALARYKTLNYWVRRRAYEAGRLLTLDETLATGSGRDAGVVWEGSRSNLFVVCGESLFTTGLDAPIVPGVMRQLVLERARKLPFKEVVERDVTLGDLARADEVFLTNSVRGLVPVRRVEGVERAPTAADLAVPGRWTARLMAVVSDWIERRGATA